MTREGQPGVTVFDGLLLALLPPLGARPFGAQAWLKWAGPGPLVIQESRLSAPDGDGSAVGAAFTLAPRAQIDSPASLTLVEPRAPRGPLSWALDGLTVTAPPAAPDQALIILWLPLLVPVPDDPHFIVAIVNSTPEPLSLPDLVFESRLRIDHQDHPYAEPGLWNGRARIEPGAAAVLRLRFDHFGAAVPQGSAVMEFACGGWSSDPVAVAWEQADA